MISTATPQVAVTMFAALLGAPLRAAAPPAAPAVTGSTRSPCDRACLAAHADAYFTTLATHDRSRLPLSRDVKYTETGLINPSARAYGKPPKACRATASTSTTRKPAPSASTPCSRSGAWRC